MGMHRISVLFLVLLGVLFSLGVSLGLMLRVQAEETPQPAQQRLEKHAGN